MCVLTTALAGDVMKTFGGVEDSKACFPGKNQ